MKSVPLTAALAMAALLSSCGSKTESTVANVVTTTTTITGNVGDAGMGNMAMPADAKVGKGTGTVTAIDKAAGKITLEHGPIPEVGWPAMTMAFKASPALLDSVAVGDKVAFNLALTGNAGEVTAIRKQP